MTKKVIIEDDDGELFLVGMNSDITESKQLEEALLSKALAQSKPSDIRLRQLHGTKIKEVPNLKVLLRDLHLLPKPQQKIVLEAHCAPLVKFETEYQIISCELKPHATDIS